MGRAFKFINATKLNHTRDPSVQRLVKSHVKKGIPRHRGVQKSPKSRSTRGCKTTEYVENGEATTSLPLRLGTVCS
ncbi:hypothetical protein MMC11_008791, partial [Xylographa trunciseda]|nr:hypothetical protein [Xylographa trunciseda]